MKCYYLKLWKWRNSSSLLLLLTNMPSFGPLSLFGKKPFIQLFSVVNMKLDKDTIFIKKSSRHGSVLAFRCSTSNVATESTKLPSLTALSSHCLNKTNGFLMDYYQLLSERNVHLDNKSYSLTQSTMTYKVLVLWGKVHWLTRS